MIYILCFLYSPELSLEQRIECLSRAVMCSKCCNLATTTSNEGEFLHELEERLEVSFVDPDSNLIHAHLVITGR